MEASGFFLPFGEIGSAEVSGTWNLMANRLLQAQCAVWERSRSDWSVSGEMKRYLAAVRLRGGSSEVTVQELGKRRKRVPNI
jgi:hypothetical protein